MTRWRKHGLIFTPGGADWIRTHSWMPTPDPLGDGYFRVYFAGRNQDNLSQVGAFTIHVDRPDRIENLTAAPILSLGELGMFDDSAVIPSCLFTRDNLKCMHYVGWMQGKRVPYYAMLGSAASADGGKSFIKDSTAPAIHRNDIDPYFVASSFVLADEGGFKMWYTTNTGWREINGEAIPRYHIKYAESEDGWSWRREGHVAIDFANDSEYAISRPWVIRDKGLYRMWYSYRGSAYRIGYAESSDGIEWERLDHLAGIGGSILGFDDEMIAYGAVVEHRGQRVMFYNGNGFGFTGVGMATEE